MNYPTISLPNPIEVQAPVNIDSIEVLHIAEEPSEKTVKAFVDYGVSKTWVSIMTPENYFSGWSDDDVAKAITEWALATFPLAK